MRVHSFSGLVLLFIRAPQLLIMTFPRGSRGWRVAGGRGAARRGVQGAQGSPLDEPLSDHSGGQT